jgi:hypothetical protein
MVIPGFTSQYSSTASYRISDHYSVAAFLIQAATGSIPARAARAPPRGPRAPPPAGLCADEGGLSFAPVSCFRIWILHTSENRRGGMAEGPRPRPAVQQPGVLGLRALHARAELAEGRDLVLKRAVV